jgi:hypothetical protein
MLLFPDSQGCSVQEPLTRYGRPCGYVVSGSSYCSGQRPSSRHVGHVNRETLKSPRRALYGQVTCLLSA